MTTTYASNNTAWKKATNIMIRISLKINVVVLIAVCSVLIAFSNSHPVVSVWGPPTAGRGILLSVYFAILFVSVLLFVCHIHNENKTPIEHMVAALLMTQILYKITTPATAGASNPVAISNLVVSVLHLGTLFLLWRQHK